MSSLMFWEMCKTIWTNITFFKVYCFLCLSNRTHWTLQWPDLLVKKIMLWCFSYFTNSLHKHLNYNYAEHKSLLKWQTFQIRMDYSSIVKMGVKPRPQRLSPHRWVEPSSCCTASLGTHSGPLKRRRTTLARCDCSSRAVAPGRRRSWWPSEGHRGHLQNVS